MNTLSVARLNLICAMVIWSTIGVARRFIDLPSGVIALVRGVVGVLFLIAVVVALHKEFNWAKIKEHFGLLALGGFFLGTNWALLFESYQHTSVAAAELSYYMNPVFIILLTPFILREHIRLHQWFCIVVAVAGMLLVNCSQGLSLSNEDALGIGLALLAALEVAGVVLCNKLIGNIGTYERAITQLTVATLALIPYTLATEDLSTVTFQDVNSWFITLLVGIVHTGMAYYCYYIGLAGVPAQEVCILGYTDPILVILWGCLIFGETLNMLQLFGAVLIVGSMLSMELRG